MLSSPSKEQPADSPEEWDRCRGGAGLCFTRETPRSLGSHSLRKDKGIDSPFLRTVSCSACACPCHKVSTPIELSCCRLDSRIFSRNLFNFFFLLFLFSSVSRPLQSSKLMFSWGFGGGEGRSEEVDQKVELNNSSSTLGRGLIIHD